MVSWKVETGRNFHAWLWRKCSEGDEKRKKEKERKTKGRRHILSAHAAAPPLVGRQSSEDCLQLM